RRHGRVRHLGRPGRGDQRDLRRDRKAPAQAAGRRRRIAAGVTAWGVHQLRAWERRSSMIIGMSGGAFTGLHVAISIVGIVSGVVVLVAMLKSKAPAGWTALFLATTVLTSVTGFLFPATGFTPAQVFGIASLVLLAGALFAFYAQHLAGTWR